MLAETRPDKGRFRDYIEILRPALLLCPPASGRARRILGAPRSVITSWSDDVGAIRDRLRRPNLLSVADGYRLACDFNHHAIHFRFQKIWSAQAEVNVESIDPRNRISALKRRRVLRQWDLREKKNSCAKCRR